MSNKWIEWNGGECPVPVGTLVDVEYRDGARMPAMKAGVIDYDSDYLAYDWTHTDNDGDIIAYRLHNPEPEKPWYEKGEFPPAGTRCEVLEIEEYDYPGSDNEWHETFIIGMDEDGYCVYESHWLHGVTYDSESDPSCFRPLQK